MKSLRLAVGAIGLGAAPCSQAQISIEPASPKFEEVVHVTAPVSATGYYHPTQTLVTMSGTTITVSVQLQSIDDGSVIRPLDVVLGRFPAGTYDVNVVTRSEAGAPVGTLGTGRFIVPARDTGQSSPLYDFTDLWWDADESGWGLALTHHASNFLFAAWHVYGSDGRPIWYVLPSGTWSNPYAYSGDVYKTTGPYFGGPFLPSNVTVTPAGTATILFTDYGHGIFSYTIDGVTGSKAIERQPF
jgi:hypothetical protein